MQPDDSYAGSGAITATLPQSRYDEAYQETQDRMLAYVITQRVSIRKGDSWEIGLSYDVDYFDFVFLDADHSYNGAYRDLMAWSPRVKPGGYICGHDYGRPDQGEVKRAVDEYFDGALGKVKTADAWTWFYRKPWEATDDTTA